MGTGYALGDWLRRQQSLGQQYANTLSGEPDLSAVGRPSGPSLFNDFRAGLQGAPAYGQDVELPVPGVPRQSPQPQAPPRSIEEAISARVEPVAPDNLSGLRAGAFQGTPEWTNNGSLAQIEGDLRARTLLEEVAAQRDRAREADEARRGNPMEDAARSLAQTRAYESLLPYGSKSSLSAQYGRSGGWGSAGGMNVAEPQSRELGGPTIGEARTLAQQEQQSLLRNRPQMMELEMRALGMQKLERLRDLAKELKSQGLDPNEVDLKVAAEERRILQELTAAAGTNLGYFNAP